MSLINGYSKGITQVAVKGSKLSLTVKKYRREDTISIDIPADKMEDVQNFLTDMNEYFKGENDAEEYKGELEYSVSKRC